MTDYADPPRSLPTRATPGAPSGRAGRRLIFFVVIAVVAWSGAWFFGARFARAEFQSWLAREGQAGRIWACASMRVGGFPFRLEINCLHPSFSGPAGARRLFAQATDARLSMTIMRPGTLRIDLSGPAQAADSSGAALKIDWRRLFARVRLAPKSRQNLLVVMTGFTAIENGPGAPVWRADHLSIDAALDPAQPNAADVELVAKGATASDLALWLNSPKPADLSLAARIDQMTALVSHPSGKNLEAWRAAGGTVSIARSRFVQDGSDIEATGDVSIDPDHRLEGQLQTQGSGLGGLLARFNAPQGVGAVAALVGGLFGGAGGSASALSLPISMSGGRLAVGPFLTSVRLDPLY